VVSEDILLESDLSEEGESEEEEGERAPLTEGGDQQSPSSEEEDFVNTKSG
jgi:hypothetical protein